MRLRFLLPSPLLLGLCLAVSPCRAATLAQYTFPTATTAETGTPYQATVVATNVTATTIADTSGKILMTTATGNYTTSPPVLKLGPQTAGASINDALTNGTFVSFTLTADAGQVLNLTSLTFDVAKGGDSGTRGYVVTSSALGHDQVLSGGDPGSTQPTLSARNVDLTGSAYQNLSSITFRLYAYSPGSGQTIDFDNITVNGSVVPEPSTTVLAALGAAAMVLRRKRARVRILS